MTNDEIIEGLKFTMDMCLFSPVDGSKRPISMLNDMDKITYNACEGAINELEQQPITWIVGKDNCQVAVRNMPIDKMQQICAIIGEEELAESVRMAIKALESQRWIPIKTRPMTEEEKEELGHEYAFMYDCQLPDDGQDVLITDCYGNVEVDTFCRDYEGVYFETNCDDGEVIAWMPLPQPYKTESEE